MVHGAGGGADVAQAGGVQKSADGDNDEGDSRRVRVIVTTQQVDRAGDIVVTSGIDTTNYLKNPVVLLQHRADSPIARCVELTVSDGRMEAVAEFPSPGVSEQSDRVLRLIRAGILNAVSIGLNPLEGGVSYIDQRDPWKGVSYNRSEMLEFSFVALPMNPGALVLQRSMGEKLDPAQLAELKALTDEMVDPPAPPPAPLVPENATEPVEPPCNPPTDAAKSIQARLRSVEVLRRRFMLNQ